MSAITFDYDQRHWVELDSARDVAAIAEVPHTVLKVGPLLQSRSPLTDKSAVLEAYRDYETMNVTIGARIEETFVPMRNALFLTLAANYAVAIDCFTLVTGVCESDNANYPDCRASFIRAQEHAINEALGIRRFKIVTPLIAMAKADTVLLAQSLPGCMEALAYSHTCYAGQVPPCGVCHACVLRAHGFSEAQVTDPLVARLT